MNAQEEVTSSNGRGRNPVVRTQALHGVIAGVDLMSDSPANLLAREDW